MTTSCRWVSDKHERDLPRSGLWCIYRKTGDVLFLMIICAAGDIHGALNRLYEDVLAFEEDLGVRFDVVLHVGDFGVWPDANRTDKATRNHDGAGDFPAWLAER